MKKLLILLSLILVPGTSALTAADTPSYGLFLNTQFGSANNLRMSDYMNARSDVFASGANTTATKKEPLFCYGFDLEGRFFSGNIVYGASIGYLSTTKGSREVAAYNYTEEITLKAMSIRGSVYYRITLESGNRVLLGGGLGYYYGTMENKYSSIYASQTGHRKDSSWTIGWHTGIEYDIVFGSFNISLSAMSRYAEFYKFRINQYNNDTTSGGFTGLYCTVGAGYTL
jgi:opacity protein-like surface antigen